jgi:hypothetical protein
MPYRAAIDPELEETLDIADPALPLVEKSIARLEAAGKPARRTKRL